MNYCSNELSKVGNEILYDFLEIAHIKLSKMWYHITSTYKINILYKITHFLNLLLSLNNIIISIKTKFYHIVLILFIYNFQINLLFKK